MPSCSGFVRSCPAWLRRAYGVRLIIGAGYATAPLRFYCTSAGSVAGAAPSAAAAGAGAGAGASAAGEGVGAAAGADAGAGAAAA